MTARSNTLSLDDAFDLAVAEADPLLDELSSLDFEFETTMLGVADVPVATEAEPNDEVLLDSEFDVAMHASGAVALVDTIGARLAASPAFAAHIAERIAAQQPQSQSQQPEALPARAKTQIRQMDFTFGNVWGPAGATTVITIRPQCRFRVEKMMATDTHTIPGTGTAIVQVAVGQKIQRPGNAARGTLSQFFAQNAIADGIKLDTAHPWEDIALTISFIQTCTFYANLFGSAEIE